MLKSEYQYYHSINQNNYYSRELFSPDMSKTCDECELEFINYMLKKNHDFLFHYNQTGGSRKQQLPINVSETCFNNLLFY